MSCCETCCLARSHSDPAWRLHFRHATSWLWVKAEWSWKCRRADLWNWDSLSVERSFLARIVAAINDSQQIRVVLQNGCEPIITSGEKNAKDPKYSLLLLLLGAAGKQAIREYPLAVKNRRY